MAEIGLMWYFFLQKMGDIPSDIGIGIFIDCNPGGGMGGINDKDAVLDIALTNEGFNLAADIRKTDILFGTDFNFL